MRLIDFVAEGIDLPELARKLARECARKKANTANWAKSRNGLVCCHSGKRLFITDENFKPLLAFASSSYIQSSGISREGNYAVCQMAYNKENDADSGATALIDVRQRQIVRQKALEVGGAGLPAIAVYEQARNILIHIANTAMGDEYNLAVQYDFDLQPDERTLREYYRKLNHSPYVLHERVKKLLAAMQVGIDETAEQEVFELLARIGDNVEMSAYQLALTYKELGALYERNGQSGKALAAYEAALALNPKIAVKQALRRLQKELGAGNGDPAVPYPRLVEQKRDLAACLAADDYTLPSTYDEHWQEKRQEYLAGQVERIRESLGLEQTGVYEYVADENSLNNMSDADFSALFNTLCQPLDEVMRKEARRIAEKRISKGARFSGAATVREEIIGDLAAMLKACKKD